MNTETRCRNLQEFLSRARLQLEQNEAAAQIMLDLCFHMEKFPQMFTGESYFKVFEKKEKKEKLLLAAAMVRPHHLVLHGGDEQVREPVESILRDFLEKRWFIPGVIGPRGAVSTFAQRWEKLCGVPSRQVRQLKIHEVKRVNLPEALQGQLRLAREGDAGFIARWIADSHQESIPGGSVSTHKEVVENRIKAGDVFLWEDGEPVSLVTLTPAGFRGIRLALVYTPPLFRGKGYATLCVASVSQMLLSSGCSLCTVIADAGDERVNRLYARIGYQPSCDVEEYVFGKKKGF